MGSADVIPILDQKSKLALEQIRVSLRSTHTTVRVCSSPLRRALATAAELCDRSEILVMDGFREWDLGEWEGELHSEVKAEYRRWFPNGNWDPRHAPPGGETLADVEHRVREAFVQMSDKQRQSGTPHVCVTHNGVIRVLRYVLGQVRAEDIFEIEEPYFELIRLPLWEDTAAAPGPRPSTR